MINKESSFDNKQNMHEEDKVQIIEVKESSRNNSKSVI